MTDLKSISKKDLPSGWVMPTTNTLNYQSFKKGQYKTILLSGMPPADIGEWSLVLRRSESRERKFQYTEKDRFDVQLFQKGATVGKNEWGIPYRKARQLALQWMQGVSNIPHLNKTPWHSGKKHKKQKKNGRYGH